MEHNRGLIFMAIIFSTLFGSEQLVSGGRIAHRRTHHVRRQDASPDMVEVPGLIVFSEYVCPSVADSLDTQSSGSTIISVPKEQLRDILFHMRVMEQELVAYLGEFFQEQSLDMATASEVFTGAAATCISVTSTMITTVTSQSDQLLPIASHVPKVKQLDAISPAADSVIAGMTTSTLQESDPSTYDTLTTTLQSTIRTTGTTVTLTSFSSPSEISSVVAASTAVTPFLDAATNVINAAAPSTTTTDSGSSETSHNDLSQDFGTPEPTTTAGGVFLQAMTASTSTPTSTAAVGETGADNSDSTGYVFNSQSSKNIAVYFGQTPVTGTTSLAAQCADPNIDIVILAFVISIADGGQYPGINFGAACGGQTPEMVLKAPGLLSCTDLANDIDTCQSQYGKKVFLSIGGATSQIAFSSETQASTFADTIWDLFGPAGNIDAGLRPFGTAEVDGFDVDNEDNLPSYFNIFASTLRTHYTATSSKTYYLSSAPQCPMPDASNPMSLLLLCDFVWVQFYNNPECEIGSTGFDDSVNEWSKSLEASSLAPQPRLYVGAPAFSAAGSSAYAHIGNAEGMKGIASSIESLGLSNLGGVMFWDGPEGLLNLEGGKDILAWAKEGLDA